MTARKLVRCAVYTRKSTEHNLDLEFNSLDAQREACEAYIKSQIHEGWVLIPDHYDDGGISGGSLNRPDLQRLLSDIRAGKVDTVVVYKVDRLTRSLTDFAKLVELFDAHVVSFVSITQAFNTTSSMGRLTLNVLLSFAQFEREVIGERVRDKIAASKAKGLWMGGNAPLGYDNREKKLLILPEEAETVRLIFLRYLELGSVGLLLQDLRHRGIKTKRRVWASGKTVGGVWFGKGALTYLLKNPIYIGKILHREQIHIGNHDPIIDQEVFGAVQLKIKKNTVDRKLKLRSSPYLLTGVLFDSAGNRMSPSHTVKKGVRYRYYVSQGLLQNRGATEVGELTRASAPDLEETVAAFLHQAMKVSRPLEDSLKGLIGRITLFKAGLKIALLGQSDTPDAATGSQIVMLPWHSKVTRMEKGIVHAPSLSPSSDAKARDTLLAAIGMARIWLKKLVEGETVSQIATQDGRSERQIRVLLNLAFLPPRHVEAVLHGSAEIDTVTNVARNVPILWPEMSVKNTQPSA
ncbi:MAG: recombinase family protein [Pseudomonadota bacterium]